MRQRKKQPEETRRKILEAAGSEFSKKGYAGTGLGAIVARTGLTKGALFHHFPDKRALATGWIDGVLSPGIAEQWIAPLSDIKTLDSLKSFCRARVLELESCDSTAALISLSAETTGTETELRDSLDHIFSQWREALAAVLERGKEEGWIHRSIQPPAEAAFMVAAFSGFSISICGQSDNAVRRHSVDAIQSYLETLRAQ